MAWPTLKSFIRSVLWPAAPPAVLAPMRLMLTCPGAARPKVSCDSWPMAPMGGMPVAPTTRAAMAARNSARGRASRASQGSMPNSRTCSTTTSRAAASSSASGQARGRCQPWRRRSARGRVISRTASAARVALTIRLTPGQSSHCTRKAYCGPLASAGSAATPLDSSQGATPPQASRVPSSSDNPTLRPMMPPKPSSSSEGSKLKVRRSRAGEGATRGSVQAKVSTSLTAADSARAPSSTRRRARASAPLA